MSISSSLLFLFDIDGTLLKGGTGVHRSSFVHAFRTVYGRELSLDGLSAAGRTDAWLLTEALRAVGVPDTEIRASMTDAFALMQEHVDEHMGDMRSYVLPGVPEVLDRLKSAGCILGLLTGNVSGIADAKMRHSGLSPYFAFGAYGEESVDRADLVPIALALASHQSEYSGDASTTVVVGDTPFDIHAGASHGTGTCGVATGSFTSSQLHASGAELVLDSFADPELAAEELLSFGARAM